MLDQVPFGSWQAVLQAPRSDFFRGHTSDTVFDRRAQGIMPSTEALFTQSNARVLLGQAANGSLRLVALPIQVYPAPTRTADFGLGPGMYHHFDVAMYVGDLCYRVALEGDQETIDLSAASGDNETFYADHFLPLTRTKVGDLDMALVSLAPVAPDNTAAPLAPAPLPGPAGVLYTLWLRNTGSTPLRGKVILQAGDMLLGHYEEAHEALRAMRRPSANLRQNTLILSRPDGAVGIHLHRGRWTRLEAPFEAERTFELRPGEEAVFEARIALGRTYHDVMPVIYALHLRDALAWLNLTAAYWRSRLGRLEAEVAGSDDGLFSRDIYIRSLFDNFNCLQTDPEGNLIAHWQGAPSHGYGTVWGIDVEPTAVSIVHLVPELARQAMVFFATRSRAPKGSPDHSVPILVAPVIIARQWLQVTGDTVFLEKHPELLLALQSIMDQLEALRAPGHALFPSRYSSDGPVGRRYDYGTNVKVYYAFDSFAYILRQLGQGETAVRYAQAAEDIREAISQTMVVEGPFGLQISGGTNLHEDPGTFYLPEDVLYYDGEDTSSMLAPVYGLCEHDDMVWVNYHRFARSLWCPNYDPEFDTLRWNPGNPGVCDGTAFFSRLGGSLTRAEMSEALRTLRRTAVDDVTGSVFWWPHGLEYKRSLTRCSQGQGAWAWQYLQQWLGLSIDVATHTLTVAPRGLLTRAEWIGFASGTHRFDVHWEECETGATARVRNLNRSAWTVRVGFRRPGAGAEGPIFWQVQELGAGEEVIFAHKASPLEVSPTLDRASLVRAEVSGMGSGDGVLFRRIAPDMLWGHWDPEKTWDARAMPLALRFVVANATDADWRDVLVEVTCPDGWLVCARQPLHWTRPLRMARSARVHLGDLSSPGRTVAPFWVTGPGEYTVEWSWDNDEVPFHHPARPEDGLRLRALGAAAPDACFIAVLRATTASGTEVHREVRVPVRIIPTG